MAGKEGGLQAACCPGCTQEEAVFCPHSEVEGGGGALQPCARRAFFPDLDPRRLTPLQAAYEQALEVFELVEDVDKVTRVLINLSNLCEMQVGVEALA